MNILYAQSPALFWCALTLIVCFFVRRGAHRVRAVLDLVLGLLCVVGGVALYYLGMYNDAFTIRDFWHIRTAGWIGLAVVVLVTVWQVVKATRRSVSARRAARQAERDEKTRQKELEDARTRAYTAGQEDAKAAARVAENVSAAAEDRENGLEKPGVLRHTRLRSSKRIFDKLSPRLHRSRGLAVFFWGGGLTGRLPCRPPGPSCCHPGSGPCARPARCGWPRSSAPRW